MEIEQNYRGLLPISWFKDNEQKIDLSPENYQRCFVWLEDKQRELLRTIFDNNPGQVPELHMRNFTTPKNTSTKVGVSAEVMDGQQRITTIMRFTQNKIKTPSNLTYVDDEGNHIDISNKYINELNGTIQKFFFDYKLQVCFYTDILDSEAAIIFKDKLNSGKPLTKPEKRNAHHTEMAKFVRNTARLGLGKYPRHPLFETGYNSKQEIVFNNFDETTFKYNDYSADVLVASICCMLSNSKSYKNTCIDSELEKMYVKEEYKDKFSHEKLVKTYLNTIDSIITSTNGKNKKKFWSLSQIKHLVRVLICIAGEEYGLKVEYPEIFTSMYVKTCMELFKPDASEVAKKQKNSYFKNCIIRQKTTEIIEYCIEKIVPLIIADPAAWGTNLKNSDRRLFTTDEKMRKLEEQNYICPMCDGALDLENAHGGHIIPYSSGGKTEESNLVMLHASCNIKLGSKDFRDWKKDECSKG